MMKLSKINYVSAFFFGAFALVMYLILGILELIMVTRIPEVALTIGNISPLQALVEAPIIWGVATTLFFLLAILIYNIVAIKFPISWETKK